MAGFATQQSLDKHLADGRVRPVAVIRQKRAEFQCLPQSDIPQGTLQCLVEPKSDIDVLHAVYGSSLGMRGDFARAEAEYEAALRMAPNAAEILIF